MKNITPSYEIVSGENVADKIYIETIVNIFQLETTLIVSVYNFKLVFPQFMNKHVLFTHIFCKYAIVSTK